METVFYVLISCHCMWPKESGFCLLIGSLCDIPACFEHEAGRGQLSGWLTGGALTKMTSSLPWRLICRVNDSWSYLCRAEHYGRWWRGENKGGGYDEMQKPHTILCDHIHCDTFSAIINSCVYINSHNQWTYEGWMFIMKLNIVHWISTYHYADREGGSSLEAMPTGNTQSVYHHVMWCVSWHQEGDRKPWAKFTFFIDLFP